MSAPRPTPFRRLLVANRGEIALRVMRTARAMGLETVAVYSQADRDAAHVRAADFAVAIGPAAPRESYLNIASILSAATVSGAEAIHPGYGFLSENPDFAEACAAAGLVFVGPSAAAIRAMGDKASAKAAMTATMGVSDSEPILSIRGLLSTFTDLLRTMFLGGTMVMSAGSAVMLNKYT